MITQERLRELLHYCPETGIFTWLVSRGRTARKGSEAGTVHFHPENGKSYRRIKVCGRLYMSHRLAFLYMTGEFPPDQVDHQDGNGSNNSWKNLRAVTHAENQKNARKSVANTSGTTGVCWNTQRNKWQSKIHLNGQWKHLGFFHDKAEAIASRKAAEVLYGYHANHGTDRPL